MNETQQKAYKALQELENLIEEHKQYLKVMEGYKNFESNTKCQHRKARTQEAFKPINETLECAEIFCLECHGVIGYALRQIKTIPQQKPKTTIITFANNKNFYKMD